MFRKRPYTFDFIAYLLKRRTAETGLTLNEQKFLSSLVHNEARFVVEVGVDEGATSKVLCQVLNPNSVLYLVDPYWKKVRLEKLLGFSFTEFIARRTVRKWGQQVTFLKLTSAQAAHKLSGKVCPDIVFVDADHNYSSVLEDFHAWGSILAEAGLLVFHDSCICTARPDLDRTSGPVRLLDEIEQGMHGNWKVIDRVDTISVIARDQQ